MEPEKDKIGLVVDETFDLPQELVDEHKITVVKFKIDFQELASLPGNVYQKIREGEKRGMKNLVKTSQPSINDFLSSFKEKLKEFEEVLCITFSSKISGAYNSALQAKKFLETELQNRVHVFDSMNGSGSEALVALKAASLIKQKFDINQVITSLQKELQNIKLLGMYKSPKWLEASGRFPPFVPAIMNQAERMDIKPVFGLRGAKLAIIGIKKNIKDISTGLFEEFEKATKKVREAGRHITIAITHADAEEQANKLKDMILSLGNTEIAFINLVCFPVGGHIGPDSIVLSWEQ